MTDDSDAVPADGGADRDGTGTPGDADADAGDRPTETLTATGHDNVAATHASTLEVTTDDYLTPAGDCILGVGADRAPADFGSAFVAACRSASAQVVATLAVDGAGTATVRGRGDPQLTFDSERSAVLRTSDYVDDRTVMVGADAAAADVDRELVAALAEGAALRVTLRVTPEGD